MKKLALVFLVGVTISFFSIEPILSVPSRVSVWAVRVESKSSDIVRSVSATRPVAEDFLIPPDNVETMPNADIFRAAGVAFDRFMRIPPCDDRKLSEKRHKEKLEEAINHLEAAFENTPLAHGARDAWAFRKALWMQFGQTHGLEAEIEEIKVSSRHFFSSKRSLYEATQAYAIYREAVSADRSAIEGYFSRRAHSLSPTQLDAVFYTAVSDAVQERETTILLFIEDFVTPLHGANPVCRLLAVDGVQASDSQKFLHNSNEGKYQLVEAQRLELYRSIITEKDPTILEAVVNNLVGIGTPAALEVLQEFANHQTGLTSEIERKISESIGILGQRIEKEKRLR